MKRDNPQSILAMSHTNFFFYIVLERQISSTNCKIVNSIYFCCLREVCLSSYRHLCPSRWFGAPSCRFGVGVAWLSARSYDCFSRLAIRVLPPGSHLEYVCPKRASHSGGGASRLPNHWFCNVFGSFCALRPNFWKLVSRLQILKHVVP